jgi:hypothetical protein
MASFRGKKLKIKNLKKKTTIFQNNCGLKEKCHLFCLYSFSFFATQFPTKKIESRKVSKLFNSSGGKGLLPKTSACFFFSEEVNFLIFEKKKKSSLYTFKRMMKHGIIGNFKEYYQFLLVQQVYR